MKYQRRSEQFDITQKSTKLSCTNDSKDDIIFEYHVQHDVVPLYDDNTKAWSYFKNDATCITYLEDKGTTSSVVLLGTVSHLMLPVVVFQ